MPKDKQCNCSATSIDLINGLPSDPLEMRATAFIYGISNRSDESLQFIKSKYKNKTRLKRAIEFVDYALVDAFKTGQIDELTKIGFFPTTEAQMEFDEALKHSLIGSYKAAYGYLRRYLELVIIHIYFSLTKNYKESVSWLKSEANTQFFSTALKRIIAVEPVLSAFNDKYKWKDEITGIYHEISDILHVKGLKSGFRKINKINVSCGGTHLESILLESLEEFCDKLISVTEHICVILAIYNPVLLEGLDLDRKFGLNGPLSGFFYPGQSEMIRELIPVKYKAFFDDFRQNDSEIKSVLDWFNGLPDITEEEIAAQVKDLELNYKK